MSVANFFKLCAILAFCTTASSAPTSSKRKIKNCPKEIPQTATRSFTSDLLVKSQFQVEDNRPKVFCPKDEFLVGYSLLHQESQGMQGTGDVFAAIFTFGYTAADQGLDHTYDDHGVLNIIPYCAKRTWKGLQDVSRTYSTECQDSSFSSGHELYGVKQTIPEYCNPGTVVTGFDYHAQKPQGTFDDAGITKVRFRCQDSKILEGSLGPMGYDPEESREEVKPWQYCPIGTGICGVEPRVELSHHDDNVGLTGMRLFCCDIPGEASTCEFQEQWGKVFDYTNCEGLNASVTYKYSVGFSSSKQTQSSNTQLSSSTSGHTIGLESESEVEVPFTAKQTLKARYEKTFGSSLSVGKESQSTIQDIRTGENSYEETIQIAPMRNLRILQKVIKCGSFDIKSIVIKKTVHTITKDECAVNN